jgi:hypothetical protein
MLYKNLPEGKVFSVIFFRMLLDGLAAVIFLVHGRFSYFGAVMKAHFSYYKSIGKLRRKREALKKPGESNTTGLILNKSIIFEFYIKGIKTFNRL